MLLICLLLQIVYFKYADDFYLLVPAVNTASIPAEINHLAKWAHNNNLRLNEQKTSEIILCGKRTKLNSLPPLNAKLTRSSTMNILGVILDAHLTFAHHIDKVVSAGAQSLYALKTLKAHGLNKIELSNICRATLISKLTYASPSWWGFVSIVDKAR